MMGQDSRGLTPQMLLAGYAQGIFPMATGRDSTALHWFEPRLRGVIPLHKFHISRSLARRMRRGNITFRLNEDFAGVVQNCAARDETWINAPLVELYLALFTMGHAHSLEVWDGDALAGGLFGISLGGAFFGESMFSRRTDGSKMALVCLVDRLQQSGFTLCDTQYLTPHLASLGGREILRAAYRQQLAVALQIKADFTALPVAPAQLVLQRMTQTS
jgi:leucyl/phenylalanyl-tRNA---protein transferase